MAMAAASSFNNNNNNSEAIMEDQLRGECYELHALRSEVADLINVQRDVECRFEYLRTVLSNLDRNEAHLKKTLAYEAATSDAVLHAAHNGQPLPPALAADAATSVLAPPVHLGRDNKNLFQTADDLAQSREQEMKQLRKEIADMDTVIQSERRSIGALQHAMNAQAAWGDSVIRNRRKGHMTHKEILGEVAAAQSETTALAQQEETLKRRVEQQIHEMNLKTRRLEELDDLKRIYSLQLEELRGAVIVGKRDLIRAQTLELECKQVAKVAQGKMQSIAWNRKNSNKGSLAVATGGSTAAALFGGGGERGTTTTAGDVEALAHAAGPMFVSALGGGAGRSVAVTTPLGSATRLGDPTSGQMPHQIATGTQRYDKNLYTASSSTSSAFAPAATWQQQQQQQQLRPQTRYHHHALYGQQKQQQQHRTVSSGAAANRQSQQQQQQQQQQQYPSAAAVAAAATEPLFGWTAAPNSASAAAATLSPQKRQKQIEMAYVDATADANEWLRRYVGSMRGLHLTALETSVATFQQQ